MRKNDLAAVVLAVFIATAIGPTWAQAQPHVNDLTVIGVSFIPDEEIPESYAEYFWEGWPWKDKQGQRIQYFPEYYQPGAYIHLVLQNSTSRQVSVADILLNGMSLQQGLAQGPVMKTDRATGHLQPTSVHYLPEDDPIREKLLEAGTPIWYRTLPPGPVEVGETVGVTVRMRRMPKLPRITVGVVDTNENISEVTVPVDQPKAKIAYVGLGNDNRTVYGYLKALTKERIHIRRFIVDGQIVPDESVRVPEKRFGAIIPFELALPEPLLFASYHLLEVEYGIDNDDGKVRRIAFTFRARDDRFDISMLMHPDDKGQAGVSDSSTWAEAFESYCKDLHLHGINTIRWLEGPLVRMVLAEEGQAIAQKYGITVDLVATKDMLQGDFLSQQDGNPIIRQWYFFDEPDMFDFGVTGIDTPDRSGVFTMDMVRRDTIARRNSPHKLTTFHLDGTYKPEHWFNYGQITDCPTTGYYYPSGISSFHAKDGAGDPRRHSPRTHYIMAATVTQAMSPRPYGFCLLGYDESGYMPYFYRSPAPEEQRLGCYYAIAGGAKSLLYYGYRAAPGLSGNPELFDSMGFVHAELATIGALLQTGYPVWLTGVATKKADGVMTGTILRGLDTAVILLINERYTSDLDSFSYTPLRDLRVRVSLPKWLKPAHVIDITCDGPRKITDCSTTELAGSVILKLRFDELDLTRAIVVTADAHMLSKLQDVYTSNVEQSVKSLER